MEEENTREETLKIIEQYRQHLSQYGYEIFLEEALRNLLKSDPNMYDQQQVNIERRLQTETVKLFISAFRQVHLNEVQNIMKMEESECLAFLEDIIQRFKLQILIDRVQKIVMKRYDQQQRIEKDLSQLQNNLDRKIQNNFLNMLNYQLQSNKAQKERDQLIDIIKRYKI